MSEEIKSISLNNEKYPSLLKEIMNPPKNIYFLGNFPILKPHIAIVGTRKASFYGKELAFKMAKELSNLGFIIVSGLALGIDSYAHLGALNSKNPQTIAVLANGLDIIYPKTNSNLFKKILENNGAIISEYQIKTPPLPFQFLERNRIISGLCIATIIIEAPLKSGTLTTARWALEQGREVFVFPGDVNNKNFFGSHLLIRNGARLVSNLNDILEDLKEILEKQYPNFLKNIKNQNKVELDKIDKIILDVLQKQKKPLTLEDIQNIIHNLTNVSLIELTEHLTFLILNNLIKENNNFYELNE